MRLKHFKVGDSVILKGAATERSAALFIGEFSEGYYYLWKNEQAYLTLKPWLHMAAASHQAEAGK